jgi:hypothetical protein
MAVGKAGVGWTGPRLLAIAVARALAVTALVPTPALADDSVDVIIQQVPGTATDVFRGGPALLRF